MSLPGCDTAAGTAATTDEEIGHSSDETRRNPVPHCHPRRINSMPFAPPLGSWSDCVHCGHLWSHTQQSSSIKIQCDDMTTAQFMMGTDHSLLVPAFDLQTAEIPPGR